MCLFQLKNSKLKNSNCSALLMILKKLEIGVLAVAQRDQWRLGKHWDTDSIPGLAQCVKDLVSLGSLQL